MFNNAALFSEATATWMEDEVYDNANTSRQDLYPNFADSLLPHNLDSPNVNEEYQMWLVLRGLTERFGTAVAGGGEDVMQDFWELQSGRDGTYRPRLVALEMALGLSQPGLTLAQAYHDAGVADWFMEPCGGAFAYPYCFEEATARSSRSRASRARPRRSQRLVRAASGLVEESNYAMEFVKTRRHGRLQRDRHEQRPGTRRSRRRSPARTAPARSTASRSRRCSAPGQTATVNNFAACTRAGRDRH